MPLWRPLCLALSLCETSDPLGTQAVGNEETGSWPQNGSKCG